MDNNDFFSSTNIDIHKLWHDAMEEISKNVSALTFDVWIKSLDVVDIVENKIILSTTTADTKARLLKNYKDVIIDSCNKLYRAITNLEIVVRSEQNELPTLQKPQKPEVKKYNMFGEDIQQNSKFIESCTFENFIVGSSNQFATAAAKAIAERPRDSTVSNPLFIYGGPGLGKTHLLFAITNYLREHSPDCNAIYVTTYKFVNDFTDALQNNKVSLFKEFYSNADVLIIDDIQQIINKTQTQEQFFNIFNDLYQRGKKIVISSDKHPKELSPLENRFRTRFQWGLIADIGVPDIETRIAILTKKAQRERYNVTREVIEYIAERPTTSVREMEGYLQRVVFFSNLNSQGIITKSMAVEALKDIKVEDAETVDATKIIETVCKFYGIKKDEILAKKRTKNVAEARQIAMYLIAEFISMPLEAIGNIFGRDHATVIYAKNKISEEIQENKNLLRDINDLKQMIEGK